MYCNRKILAVVPARSGSKGFPHKNLHRLNGISLIGHAARCLRSLPWIDTSVISTDSTDYCREAEHHGLSAPFLRPAELSTDTAGAVETMQHAVARSESIFGVSYDIILIVEPTSPLRLPADVTATVERLIRTGASSVVTVSGVDSKYHPQKLLTISTENRLSFFSAEGAAVTHRQALSGKFYIRNGVCYALTRKCLMDRGAIFVEDSEALIITRPVANIDGPDDIRWAEFLIQENPHPEFRLTET